MGFLKDQIKTEITNKIREQIALKQQKELPIKKNVGGFLSNVSRNITEFAKGIVGLGYQAVRHPIESAKNIGAGALELSKQIPSSAVGLGKQMAKTVVSPIKTAQEGISGIKELRKIPFEEQKKIFNDITEIALQQNEKGKKMLGILGSELVGATVQEISHPLQYGYENPFNMALDALTLGQATGANKLVSASIKAGIKATPATAKISSALKEVFTPNGKLVVAGFEDVAKDLTKTKSEIFKVQRDIVESTVNKFNKELKLSPAEQTEFFETIDKLRRVKEPTVTPTINQISQPQGITPIQEGGLIAETRKYKSAEEFVKNNDFIFQGGKQGTKSGFWTTNLEEAKRYAGKDGEIRVARFSDMPEDLRLGLNKQEYISQKTPHISADKTRQPETIGTLNPKSQLTDIWNQPQGITPKQEATKAISTNPKIQKAIDWWINEEAPKLAEDAGLPKEQAIQNYLHHFFPDKFKNKEVALTKPLQYSKKGYLKQSKDVEGFTKDPVLSISAIKSKVAIDNLRDGFIKNTIDKYAVKTDTLIQKLTDAGIDIAGFDKTALIEKAKQVLGLEEYKPKGSLRFFPVITETGSKVAGATTKVETHLLPKVIVEELNKFTTGGKSTMDKLFLPFDIFNRNWKPLATAVRLRYHTRNVVGNLYNAIVIGKTNIKEIPIALLNQVKGHIAQSIKSDNFLGKIYKPIFGNNIPTPEVIKQAIDNDVIGRGFFGADVNDLVLAVDKGEDIMKTIKNINTPAEIYKIPVLKQWLVLTTKAGQFLEDNARLAMFQQGLKKFAGDVNLAKGYVDKHLFDYITGLGEADKIIKRFIPFWSWTRFNIPLQLGGISKLPLRHLALQKGGQGYVKSSEISDEGYQYLSEQEKEMGYIKTGTTQKGGKEYDTYIKTASVLPVQDVARLVRIFKGQDEEIGITPLKQIYDLITKDPTKFNDFFGQPIEQFAGEKEKFLGMSISGKNKALLSNIPALTELNKLIGGSYIKGEEPKLNIRIEQVLSPTGLTLVNRENNKFYRELDKEKELTGSYTAGLESIYKRYLKLDMKYKGEEKYIGQNVKILEKILKQKGLNQVDLLKIKTKAIKALLQDALMGR